MIQNTIKQYGNLITRILEQISKYTVRAKQICDTENSDILNKG